MSNTNYFNAIQAVMGAANEQPNLQRDLSSAVLYSGVYARLMAFVEQRDAKPNHPLLGWADAIHTAAGGRPIDVKRLIENAGKPQGASEEDIATAKRVAGALKTDYKSMVRELEEHNAKEAQKVADVAEQAESVLDAFIAGFAGSGSGEPEVDAYGALKILSKWKDRLSDVVDSARERTIKYFYRADAIVAEALVAKNMLERVENQLVKIKEEVERPV